MIIKFQFSVSLNYFLNISSPEGDIETNPGPAHGQGFFKFMHWSCNSLPAHDFERVPLLQAYSAIEKFNVIAITESAL